ncbi:MAG: TetR/AcrR family transcriptional regulator [Ilumatobacteraceae bacterium]|nr:TetR/AcrR family transcriptional regulator [Ilumatobacteraceae bacterium]
MSAHNESASEANGDSSGTETRRIGRPPKVDEHGTPTRERLLNAAIDVCVEYGYAGVTLSEIARRADVSTPAVYSHFDGKAELLITASKRELEAIGGDRLPAALGLRNIARQWLSPDFAKTRILVGELHRAAVRHPDVASLLDDWLLDNSVRFQEAAGMTLSQIKMFYLLILGATNLESVSAVEVDQDVLEAEMITLIEGWLSDRYS